MVMAASMLYLVIVFGGLSVVALLLVGIHDAVAAYFSRRTRRVSQGAAEKGQLLLQPPRARTPAPRALRAPQSLLLRGGAEVLKDRPNDLSTERPAWIDSARRDVAHR